MKLPPVPANETHRLAVLRSLGILDTPPDPEIDELTRLAAYICGTPMALVTLIDSDRQWFKSKVGLGGSQNPREESFCAHVICEPERELFVVPDALADERFRDNPAVLGAPNVRFYAGAPLVTSDGAALGSLCVVDRSPRELNEEQRQALSILRRQVVNAFELRRALGERERVIGELHQARGELDRARCIAEEAARSKAIFLANMSHEIRTPMNSVIGMTAVLRSTALNSEQAECVDIIRTGGELLLEVINDVLDFSKIESGQLELERLPFALAPVVESTAALLSARSREKGVPIQVSIAPDTPAGAVGDAVRLRQILLNLLSNALKFTERGRIDVSVSARPAPDGLTEFEFAVADTGIGIPADRIGRLFREFSQAETSTGRRFGGTGLGLAISKRLAELQGGGIRVESEPGRGSRFSFTILAPAVGVASLPATVSPAEELEAGFAERHPARILVVDDNELNRKVARRLLEKLGYQPRFAEGGPQAIETVRQHPVDLVLMDVEMPEMDGLTATREIRRLQEVSQPAIAAVTAHALGGNREKYLSAGMDEHLAKPLRIADLKNLLRQVHALRTGRK